MIPRLIIQNRVWGHCSASSVLSSRLKSTSTGDDYQFWQRSRVPSLHFQKSLPRLPIPELSKTCERYLKAQRPILNDESFKKTESIVKRFESGEGMALHKELKDQDSKNKHTSYISEPWSDMYLRDRVPLPINYNPVLGYIDFPNKEYNGQLIKATNMLISSLRFFNSLRHNILEPEVFHLYPKKSDTEIFRTVTRLLPPSLSWYGAYMFNAYPLDMSQYGNIFNSTRIPELGKDRIFRDSNARHMLLMRKGNFYIFDVFDNSGNIVEPDVIYSCVKHVLDDQSSTPDFPVSVLTTENRDKWAVARKHIENIGNADTLRLVDTAVFCLSLDDEMLDGDEKPMRAFLHSDGINRWFDKSFSLIIARNGKTAINFEHSWGDGVAMLRYFQDVFKDSTSKPWIHPSSKPANCEPHGLVKKLEFKLDDKAKEHILEAKRNHEEITKSLGFNFLRFYKFGKKLCKTAKVSPDSIMQLGFQVAYNKLAKTYVGTYESCSTAAFKHGRTETMRPCTMATKAFCEALNARSRPSSEELLNMLRDCSKAHGNLTKEAAMGQGFDRHLFALRKLAEKKGGSLPALYTDEAYAKLNHHIISTSTLSSDMFELGGFGPVVKDGLGIGYSIIDEGLGAIVTNYPKYSDGAGFTKSLEEAFNNIYDVLKTSTK